MCYATVSFVAMQKAPNLFITGSVSYLLPPIAVHAAEFYYEQKIGSSYFGHRLTQYRSLLISLGFEK